VHVVDIARLKARLVPLTHENKYASGTMKFVELLEMGVFRRPKIPIATGLISIIERIQERFTKEIEPVVSGRRTFRADLIKVYKIIHELSSVKFSTFLNTQQHGRTRSHSLKLNKKCARLDLRHC